ncbi:angiopoietin-related protein 7-like [Anoplophora glabripennis]|uniref:angiopoietin-related protein 7-like n=1 Tax=Anoplophora glabripennis TaxID=217634 RepID=UPI0008737AF6|nr:angiopoietin-related protein 7-like [Anoplophora glabripennis]
MFIQRLLICAAVVLCVLTCLTTISANTTTTTIRPHIDTDDNEYYHRRYNSGRRNCDTEQIEYRLTKLEVQLGEKSAHLTSELREGNRRLQALEIQSAEVQTSVEGFRNEMSRIANFGQTVPANYYQQAGVDKMESKISNLVKGMQLVVATLRSLNSDVTWIKKNISSITNATDTLLHKYNDLTTKQFLSNSLIDVKHNQLYPPIPPNIFREPDTSNLSHLPRNCKNVQENGNNVSGIYLIQPHQSHSPFMVLCDMDTKDGGWTYIHNRYDGSQDFFNNWHDYKIGFGNIGGEFWLGLEHIYQLTGHEVNELLVELVDADGDKAYAHYAAFSIGSEQEGYALKVLGGYNGDAGDSLIYHAGSRFSTKDFDQDSWVEGNCAQAHSGAWWYRGCDTSNLNGKYLSGPLPDDFLYQGMYWAEFRGAQYSLSQARMMIRPRGPNSPPIFPEGLFSKGN